MELCSADLDSFSLVQSGSGGAIGTRADLVKIRDCDIEGNAATVSQRSSWKLTRPTFLPQGCRLLSSNSATHLRDSLHVVQQGENAEAQNNRAAEDFWIDQSITAPDFK
jgi:hypothetical protein